jgi:HDOD domain
VLSLAKISSARGVPKAVASAEPFEHTPEGIVGRLRELVREPDYNPPLLSVVALDLIELSRDPDVDLGKVRAMMEREPLLAGKVMSIAQSPFYSRGAPVDSLDEALMRLGVKRLTGIFMEAAMKASVLDSKAFEKPMEILRRHSTATAHIARGVCRSLKQPGERAFLCGLLHDIGSAACLAILGNLPKNQRPKDFETISKALQIVHEEASGILGAKCRRPRESASRVDLPVGLAGSRSRSTRFQRDRRSLGDAGNGVFRLRPACPKSARRQVLPNRRGTAVERSSSYSELLPGSGG